MFHSVIYAEAAYFDGNHCAHVAAYEENLRRERIAREMRTAARSWGRNTRIRDVRKG